MRTIPMPATMALIKQSRHATMAAIGSSKAKLVSRVPPVRRELQSQLQLQLLHLRPATQPAAAMTAPPARGRVRTITPMQKPAHLQEGQTDLHVRLLPVWFAGKMEIPAPMDQVAPKTVLTTSTAFHCPVSPRFLFLGMSLWT